MTFLLGRSGRLGNLGKATSLVDLEVDIDVVGPLLNILKASGTSIIPDWLVEAGGVTEGDSAGTDEQW